MKNTKSGTFYVKNVKAFSFLLLVFLSTFSLITATGCTKKTGPRKLQIAVVPKGTTHEFWKSIHAGAIRAAQELDVDIIWKGPQREDDREQQVMVVEDFISRGVDGIVLAPLDDRALMVPVREASRASIPVAIIDSALQGQDFVSFISTDNYRGGVLGARRLGEILQGKGKIILMRCQEGSASTMEREQGFLDTIVKEFPQFEFLSKDQYGGATVETAYKLAENLLSRFPEVVGIFTPNESTTFATLRALQEADLAGKVKFVGFDSSIKLVEAMKQGMIDGLVLQNPFNMGYLGVKKLVTFIREKKIEKRVDTGAYLATRENMDQPDIRDLLLPDLSKYIKE